MKKLLLFTTLLITASSFGQCLSIINGSKSSPFDRSRESYQHFYAGVNLDVSNAFQIDETRTEPRGLDYDIEIGYRDYDLAYYAFYGNYKEKEYTNYGIGVDYFIVNTKSFDLGLGANVGVINKPSSYTDSAGIDRMTEYPVSYFAYAGRVKGLLMLTNYLGVTLTTQYQQRPDRSIHGIFEVMAGIQININ